MARLTAQSGPEVTPGLRRHPINVEFSLPAFVGWMFPLRSLLRMFRSQAVHFDSYAPGSHLDLARNWLRSPVAGPVGVGKTRAGVNHA